jgi:hypothetical protein
MYVCYSAALPLSLNDRATKVIYAKEDIGHNHDHVFVNVVHLQREDAIK